MMDSTVNKPCINKEDILNYEYRILEQEIPQAKPVVSHSIKYSFWELHSKVESILGHREYQVRWIGNSPTAYL